MTYRKQILMALEDKYLAKMRGHIINLSILLDSPTGVAEHPDILATVEAEIAKIAECEERLQAVRCIPHETPR